MAGLRAEQTTSIGLTTTRAPFIEQAQAEGELYIHQPYELYSEDNHDAWRRLFARMKPAGGGTRTRASWRASTISASIRIGCRGSRTSTASCSPLTGFKAKPVSGYVPAFLFFDCLRNREFPTTITIRDGATLDYLPEPDIFHDIAGHVPMHTDRAFADTLVRFGECAHTAAEIVAGIRDEQERVRRITSIIKAMARFFWFTIEFGLMRSRGRAQGLRQRPAQLATARSSTPSTRPWCSAIRCSSSGSINQYFEIDHYQPLLFIVDSFDHLFELVNELERWMREGQLDNVVAGRAGGQRAGSPELSGGISGALSAGDGGWSDARRERLTPASGPGTFTSHFRRASRA